MKASEGVILTGVLQDGPAALAGVRPGDVIVRVGDKAIDNVPTLLATVASLKPGVAANFQVQRGDQMLELAVTPGVRPRLQRARR